MSWFRALPSREERAGGRPRPVKARTLRLEPLEPRALLSVSVLGETFKTVAFTATGGITGDVSASGTHVAFEGKARLAGTLVYDKLDHGTIGNRGATFSANGDWDVDILSGTWDLSGYVAGIEDQEGLWSGSAVVENSHVRGPLDADLTGTYRVTQAALNPSDFSLDLKLDGTEGVLAFTGSFNPTETEPFDVVVSPTWGEGGVQVAVTVPGRVHQVATWATPVTQITLSWVRGNKLLSTLDDTIPVYWNEASGSYLVTDLPAAPAKATGLAFMVQFDGVTRRATLPLLSVAGTSVEEGNDPQNGNQAIFTVTLAQPYAEPVTVGYTTVGGTAKPGDDFQAETGAIVIPAGQTVGTISVPILGDTTFEGDETFSVRLTKIQNTALGKTYAVATCTLTNDDLPPRVSIADAALVEPASGTARMVFVVTLSNPSTQTTTVTYATRDSTAQAGEDYVATSGSVTFAPGKTSATLAVPVTARREAVDREFYVDLSAPENATIADAEGVGTICLPLLSIVDTCVVEGNLNDSENQNWAVFQVVLSQAYSDPVAVWYTTVDGSAKTGIDFQRASDYLVVPSGETTATIKVPILGDTTYEPDETFSVRLTKAQNVALDRRYAKAVGTILNDDSQPTICVADASVVRPTKGTAKMVFTVVLSNPSYQAITVKYQTTDDSAKAGQDYRARSGTLRFAPGATAGTFTVTVLAGREGGELDFFVNLSAARNATILEGEAIGSLLGSLAFPRASLGIDQDPRPIAPT